MPSNLHHANCGQSAIFYRNTSHRFFFAIKNKIFQTIYLMRNILHFQYNMRNNDVRHSLTLNFNIMHQFTHVTHNGDIKYMADIRDMSPIKHF